MIRPLFPNDIKYPTQEEIERSPVESDLRHPEDKVPEKIYTGRMEFTWRVSSPEVRKGIIEMLLRLHPDSCQKVAKDVEKMTKTHELGDFRNISFSAVEFRDIDLCWAFDGKVFSKEQYLSRASEFTQTSHELGRKIFGSST